MQTRSAAPTWRRVLVTAHLIMTVALLGADLALLALGVTGLHGADPNAVYPAAHEIAAWIVAPLAVGALGSGLVLALASSWGLVTYGWITFKLVATSVLMAVLLLVLVPALARATDAPAALTAAQRLKFVIGPAVASVVVLANSLLGRYKPRWRLRATAS